MEYTNDVNPHTLEKRKFSRHRLECRHRKKY